MKAVESCLDKLYNPPKGIKMLNNTSKNQQKNVRLELYNDIFNVDSLIKETRNLKNIKVLHINSVKMGGGVADILSHIVPLFNDIGIQSHWWVPEVFDNDFFTVTKRQHNMLQGIDIGSLSENEQKKYWNIQEKIGKILAPQVENYDIIIIHDTQFIGVINYIKKNKTKMLYRCHIDTSTPNPFIYDFFIPLIKRYDATIYHLQKFKLKNSPNPFFLLPSIDPFDAKNDINMVTDSFIYDTISDLGLDPSRPILLQVGRFDPAKGFERVCNVFKRLKSDFPDIQLLLTGAGAKDDPEFNIYIEKIRNIVRDVSDTVVRELPFNLIKLNAVQQSGTIVYALSKREGFGLVVSEASVKKRPVIVTNVGGLPEQVVNGKTGYVVSDVNQAAEKTSYLLENEDIRKSMGREGRKYILSHFITPVHVKNYLRIFKKVLEL